MKYLTIFATIISATSAGRPQLSLKVSDGSFADLGGLDPTISWESSSSQGDVDLDFGIDVVAQANTDIGSYPKTIWGKAKKSVSGWDLTARAEMKSDNFKCADFEVDAENSKNDVKIHLEGRAGSDVSVSRIEATKTMEMNDGNLLKVTPRYNVASEAADVVVGYGLKKTNVEVTASRDSQEVTVSQQLDDNNRVAPSITSDGKFSVEWERSLGESNKLITKVRPNDSINVEWTDDAWTANVNMPLDGQTVGGPQVSIKRDVNF